MKRLLLLTLLVGCSHSEPPKVVKSSCHRYLIAIPLKGNSIVFEADDVQHDGGPPKFVDKHGTPVDFGDNYRILDRGADYCEGKK